MTDNAAPQSDARPPGRSFAWLNATQFLGALNDNVFKLLLVYFVIDLRGGDFADTAVAIGGGVFVLPFLLFSAAAGVLADRLSKRTVIVSAKFAELAAMLLGCAAFLFASEIGLYAVLFLMAAQSAFFGPSKYGIVPELVGRERLSQANGYLQAFTYLAIILGTALAPFLSRMTGGNYTHAGVVCVALAGVGILAGLPIRRTPSAGSGKRLSWFFLREIWQTMYRVRRDRYLVMAVWASAYFSMIGAFAQLNLIPYAIQSLGLDKEAGSYLFLMAAVGIGLGALLAGRLSGRNVELGIVPLGAFGLAVSALALGWLPFGLGGARAAAFGMGFSAGLFVVPVEAWIQFRAPPAQRGSVLAASSFLSWVGVALAAALIFLLGSALELDARVGFAVIGIMTLVLTAGTLFLLPDFLLRFFVVMLTRLCYRVRTVGIANVPLEGPALLVCNHVSWVDAVLLMATQQRRIRFLAGRHACNTWWARPGMRLLGVIPISAEDSPKRLVKSLRAAREALDQGYLVCIFAEGALTRTGMPKAFRAGFEHIVKGTPYPIIPVYLGGAWGSIFSYFHGRPMSHLPASVPYPVTVLFGEPLPSTASTAEVRESVLELSAAYFDERKRGRRSLVESFIRCARRNWSRRAVQDTTGRKLTFGRTLCASLALAEQLREPAGGQPHVGILLPPSVGAVLANLAVLMLRKVPVNLNYTASGAARASALRQCDITCVITARAFLKRLGGDAAPPGCVCLEDILPAIGSEAKRRAWLRARFMPARLLGGSPFFSADDVAAIIFSSGSSGAPKGVMLSHHNILSNVEASRMVFHPAPNDCVCGTLPFFHSFGLTGTFWLPLLSGFRAVYHANPLEAARVAETVRTHRATVLFTTPTFLAAYTRRAAPEDFRTLRLVVAGAEKLRERAAQAFRDRFGVRPIEGYGATELSPVATLNLPDVEVDGVRQVGTKPGTVGHPLPGVVVRVVDPDTGQALPTGQPGRLLVKGPNVMLGYLNRPEKTREVLRDGWYDTGDVAAMDRDGFVRITGRLSRLSKIGGEMVPHGAVEDALLEGLAQPERTLAVTGVADPERGERLVVLYTEAAGSVEELRRLAASAELPNLWKPRADAFVEVDELPLLGSGKLDLVRLRELAQRVLAPGEEGAAT